MPPFQKEKIYMRLIVFALACLLVGCGGAGRFPVVPVEGKVVFADGSNLPSGTRLLFNPSEGKVNTASTTVSQDGSFTLQAESCKYVVVLQPPEGSDNSFYKMVPSEYCTEDVFVADVKAGMDPLSFKVVKPKKK